MTVQQRAGEQCADRPGSDDANQLPGNAMPRRRPAVVRLLRMAVVTVLVLAFASAAGFAVFAQHIGSLRPQAGVPASDAIVVLTGGHKRLETALGLLEAGKGKRLLISGVHPGTRLSDLRRAVGGKSALFDCCVDLDRTALDTVGNAAESAKWLSDHGFRDVLLVTNNYHMPRSLLEARRAFTNITVRPYPVVIGDLGNGGWLTDPEALRVLATEYLKYLAALTGTSPRYLAASVQ